MLLSEIHYSDLFPAMFQTFRKKYGKISREQTGYYVQFTNHQGDKLSKSAYESPDHSDPAGIYAYPLQYVINYPADIWYGASARYLRVLKNTARNPLWIKGLTKNQAERIIAGAFGDYRHAHLLEKARREFKWYRESRPNQWSLSLMSVLQLDMDAEPETNDWGNKRYPVRSAKEQTRLFLNAGYDAIIDDTGGRTRGVINQREPEQIIFLTRASFEVVEVFDLRPGSNVQDTASLTYPDLAMNRPFTRKVAARVASVMGDRLGSDQGKTTNLGGWEFFWTKAGRRIELLITRPSRFYDHKLGEKPHKYDRLGTDHRITVRIVTEHGTAEATIRDRHDTIDNLIHEIRTEFNALVNADEIDSNFRKQNATSWAAEQEKLRRLHLVNKMMKERGLDMQFDSVEQLDRYRKEQDAKGLNVFGEHKFDIINADRTHLGLRPLSPSEYKRFLNTPGATYYLFLPQDKEDLEKAGNTKLT